MGTLFRRIDRETNQNKKPDIIDLKAEVLTPKTPAKLDIPATFDHFVSGLSRRVYLDLMIGERVRGELNKKAQ